MTPSEINVDQLMRQIRQAVAQRTGENSRNGELVRHAPSTDPRNDKPAVGQIDGSRLALQPDFQTSQNGYHANDLLKYHGETFVRNAYRAILKREPDVGGMSQNLASLAEGKLNKIDVLASLRYSPEGERVGVNISGLAWPAYVRRIERLPVIGYLLQVAIGLARLPAMLTHQRQYEFYALTRQEQVVAHVNEMNAQLAERANESSARALTIENDIRGQQEALQSLHGEINSALGALQNEIAITHANLRDVEARAAALASQLGETAATLDTAIADQKSTQTHWQEEFQKLTTARQHLQDELESQQRRLEEFHELAQIQTGLNEEGLDELYASFEDQFRGEREEIKNRLRVYLPVLERANVTQDVLDIGCGRGEWLELLRDNGKQGRGVDHNRIFIDRCRNLGLDVVQRDAIAYLADLPDASLNAITSFHLVEHLPFKVLMQLLDEMARVLRPGSPLILETPNPENFIVGSHTFYADPTHRNPIPSATLSFLLESRGLTNIEVMLMRPWEEAKLAGDDELTKRFNEYFYGSPDYGIVGWKK